ncbi:ECF family RNA polymerase sigma factor [Sorangium cellulosum]|uniref:ECF family RNA polymerase sigma factor n=1 Tax=Sorangium cellulosum TaxID=56 RepID=A0A2L0F1H8_SORCE|nr:sigma-70 family RNA polymerase sigma factor [Sorangium cellulosum]AUX45329.1 ECF family RNA polymerase sigma factor [Sorangium cellulosum]
MRPLVVSGGVGIEIVAPVALPDMGLVDTETPAAKAKQRDARLRRLVDAYLDFVGRVLRNAGTPAAEIDDAVQRTFIAAARRLDDVRPGAEKSFLLQIALHVAAHARRSAARRREVPAAEPPEVVDSATPEQLTSQKRARQMLDQVLDEMELDLRTVFVLYEFEEMSMVEIASVLGIPQGTVASRLRRARADFRERVRALERAPASEVER